MRLLSAYARRDAGPSVSLVLATIYIDDPGGSFFILCSRFLDAGLKGTTGKDMCSKAGGDGPFHFLLSTIMSAAICNADAEVIVESLSSP